MSNLIHHFVKKTNFESYEDFKENFKVEIPDNFNFAYDVIDRYAAENPQKIAFIWCDDYGNEKIMTFGELKTETDKAANLFQKYGVKKGSSVILTLKSRYTFWICLPALHKIGAIAVPATHMLKVRDIVYRIEKSRAVGVVSIAEDGLDLSFEEALRQLNKTDFLKFNVGGNSKGAEGWIDFEAELAAASSDFVRPSGNDAAKTTDDMLYYFSSGTTGFPKMVCHNFTYPLGHIQTAGYWQNVSDDGLHYTMADSGWAKCVWGKIYGQWILGTAVFIYDYDRFDAGNMMTKISKYGVTTFCAPPTTYRFFIKEDLSKYNFSTLQYCVVAGEPLNPEVYEKFKEFTGMQLMEGYGQTEVSVCIATLPWMTWENRFPGMILKLSILTVRNAMSAKKAKSSLPSPKVRALSIFPLCRRVSLQATNMMKKKPMPLGMTVIIIRETPPGKMRTVTTGLSAEPMTLSKVPAIKSVRLKSKAHLFSIRAFWNVRLPAFPTRFEDRLSKPQSF